MVAYLLPKMEVNAGNYAGVLVAVIVVLCTWRFMNLMWFQPKKIEKLLRAQGLKGSSYKFMYGDLKEMAQMAIHAKAKPIGLKDDIVPRVLPFVHKSIATYGTYKCSFTRHRKIDYYNYIYIYI